MAEAPVVENGIFNVSNSLPYTEEDGSIGIATCHCGCSGSVVVKNTIQLSTGEEVGEEQVLMLQK